MAIERGSRYVLIYVACSFGENLGFARNIAKNFAVEVPYAYEEIVGSEVREHFDSYLYILEDPSFEATYREICRMYYNMTFTVLGTVGGDQVLGMLNRCRNLILANVEKGAYYQVVSGPYRNLVLQVESIQGELATGRYQVLGQWQTLTEDIRNLRRYQNEAYVNFQKELQLVNLQERAFAHGEKRALVVDAYNVLYRNFFNYDRLYTARESRFVGGAFGFYFTLLKLKEFYPEYELHVVFDGVVLTEDALLRGNIPYRLCHSNYSKQFWSVFAENKAWAARFTRAAGLNCYLPEKPLRVDYLLGSVVSRLLELDYCMVYVYSSNDNYMQLVEDRVKVLLPKDKYKEHSQLVDHNEVLNQYKVGQIRKLNWYRAIRGHRPYGVPSINMYYNTVKADSRVLMSASYLGLIRNCETLPELEEALRAKPPFELFLREQFRQNYETLELRRDLLRGRSLEPFGGRFDQDRVKALLEENSFLREVEVLERTSRIFQSLW